MGSRSATELLLLPVQLNGILLGHPVDLLLDAVDWRALGFVVLCGDDVERFLVFAGGDLHEDEIAVPSAFLLLEDVGFYRGRSRSLRALRDQAVLREGRAIGELDDLLLRRDGIVEALIVYEDEALHAVEPAGTTIEPEHVSTA
jgi:hypothetical protein